VSGGGTEAPDFKTIPLQLVEALFFVVEIVFKEVEMLFESIAVSL